VFSSPSGLRRLVPGRRITLSAAAILSVLAPSGLLAPNAVGTGKITKSASSVFDVAEVAINPGGGYDLDGSDGVRIILNRGHTGRDGVFYRSENQYCCDAARPSLAVGATSFGRRAGGFAQVGRLSGFGTSLPWTTVELISSSGAVDVRVPVSDDAPTDNGGDSVASTLPAGSGSALIRYTATKDGKQYIVDRTVTYTYPSNKFVDSYRVTIPQGNTEEVKLYQGGDAAPGGSDIGEGVMLTAPVRALYSVNPESGIQLGYSELREGLRFVGATSRHYYDSYDEVESGGDIGFNIDPERHDAGLMVQWNLGAAPGTQVAGLRTSAGPKGVSLDAEFDKTSVTSLNDPVTLNLQLINTDRNSSQPVSFQVALPDGLTVGKTAVANSCSGTLVAIENRNSLSLSGSVLPGASNCVIGVPVVASRWGSFFVTPSSASNVTVAFNDISANSVTYVSPPPPPAKQAPIWVDVTLPTLEYMMPVNDGVKALGAPLPNYAVTDGQLPAGLTLSASSGTISGTPTGGAYDFTVTASNGSGPAVSQRFTGRVVVPAVTMTLGFAAGSTAAGSSIKVTGEGLLPGSNYKVSVSPSGGESTDRVSATGSFTGTHVLADSLPAGRYSVTVTAVTVEGKDITARGSFTVGADGKASDLS
jgi:hypothetical protein